MSISSNSSKRIRHTLVVGCSLLAMGLFSCTTEKNYYPTTPSPNKPPTLTWISPSPGSTVRDTALVSFSAEDDSGVDSVAVYVDGAPALPPHQFTHYTSESWYPVTTTSENASLDSSLRWNDETVFVSSESYTFLWNTLADSDGIHSLEARAWDKVGNMGSSDRVEVRVENWLPAAPDSLIGQELDYGVVSLRWRDRAANESGYIVERQDSSALASYHTLVVLDANSNSYNDSTITPDTYYSYRVSAIGRNVISGYSNAIALRTMGETVLSDGFESYAVGGPPDSCWITINIGESKSYVSSARAHTGMQSLCVHNPANNDYTLAMALIPRMKSGVITLWAFIPSTGYLGIGGCENSDLERTTFRIEFHANGAILAYSEPGDQGVYEYFPFNKWFKLQITIEKTPGWYTFNINDGFERGFYAPGQNGYFDTFYILGFTNAPVLDGYVDDVNIRHIIPSPR